MDGPSNILNNMDNTSNVPSTSFGAPLEVYNLSQFLDNFEVMNDFIAANNLLLHNLIGL